MPMLLAGCHSERSSHSSETAIDARAPVPGAESSMGTIAKGVILLKDMEIRQAMDVYVGLTGAELQVEQGVWEVAAKISLDAGPGLTRAEGVRLMEQALRDQAGILMVHLDATHVLVKYDATLMTHPKK